MALDENLDIKVFCTVKMTPNVDDMRSIAGPSTQNHAQQNQIIVKGYRTREEIEVF